MNIIEAIILFGILLELGVVIFLQHSMTKNMTAIKGLYVLLTKVFNKEFMDIVVEEIKARASENLEVVDVDGKLKAMQVDREF